MINLIKYDFIRKYKLISIVLISSVLLNLLLIFKYDMQGSIAFLGIYPFIMILLYVIDIIKMYSDDLNKKSGYMLFMTPNSGYKIIISKVITAILEGVAIALLYFLFIFINALYMLIRQNITLVMSEIIAAINNALSMSLGFNLGHVFVFLAVALLFSISFILTVYTSITIRKSIFSEIKFGGFFSFIIFVVLNYLFSSISSNIQPLAFQNNTVITYGSLMPAADMLISVLPLIALMSAEIIALALGSGYLLEKTINL